VVLLVVNNDKLIVIFIGINGDLPSGKHTKSELENHHFIAG
jgi:hypothetical protein